MKQFIFGTTIVLFSIGSALAGPAADAAKAHFSAIGAGDVKGVMQSYADNPQLHWIGGPLDGVYAGADNIRAVWEKFGKASGPLKVTVDKLEESANPKGATVSANVQFDGKQAIKVRYVLTYRDGKLANEIWQIDPALTLAAY